jgi:hypothetical protein
VSANSLSIVIRHDRVFTDRCSWNAFKMAAVAAFDVAIATFIQEPPTKPNSTRVPARQIARQIACGSRARGPVASNQCPLMFAGYAQAFTASAPTALFHSAKHCGFVQSGFCEVALTPERAAPLLATRPHRTLKILVTCGSALSQLCRPVRRDARQRSVSRSAWRRR